MENPDQHLTSQHYLICRVRTRLCALPMACIIETMRPLQVETLGKTVSYIRGLALVRGAPVPVVDAGSLIGLSDQAHPKRWVTVRTGGRCVAFEVEDIVGVRVLEGALLRDIPPLLEEAWGELIENIGALDTELLVVLRAIRVIPDEVWKSLEQEGFQA